jgi:PadR family transcriptional regulator, regulatory protein PadR
MDLIQSNIAVENFQKGLNTGIAELILLSVVNHSKQPMYGYQIAKVIEKENQATPVIKLGTLYPFLRSLEKSGFLESRMDPSVTGPPRRYYQITELGQQTLEQLSEAWNRTKTFTDNILAGVEYDK